MKSEAINSFLGNRNDAVLTLAFKDGSNRKPMEGEIEVDTGRGALRLKVEVPPNFPVSGLRFTILETDKAHRHLLRNGWICMDSPFCLDPVEKLTADFNGLREWIQKYYESPHDATHYEYLELPRSPVFMLFEEETKPILLQEGEFGEFDLLALHGLHSLVQEGEMTTMALSMGNKRANWAQAVFNMADAEMELRGLKEGRKGFWYFLGKEPLTEHGRYLETWKDLWEMTGKDFKEKVYEMGGLPAFNETHFGFVPISLGYSIPGREEIHWELVLFPIHGASSDEKIAWGKTVNAAYSRFFGRGRLHADLTDKKVLILGLGALGSSLAHILTRGGVRELHLCDHDIIEMGNVCRSQYFYTMVHRDKAKHLGLQLVQISPYLDCASFPSFPVPLRHSIDFGETKKGLAEYDVIFDCTAEDKISWMLDAMKLPNRVVHLSVTDGAEHLLCISERHGIMACKQRTLLDLGKTGKPTFYEGEGCHSPTFRAGFADLNMLLNQAIVHLDQRSKAGQEWHSILLTTHRGPHGVEVSRKDL